MTWAFKSKAREAQGLQPTIRTYEARVKNETGRIFPVSSFSSLPSLSLVSSRHEGSWGLIHFCQREFRRVLPSSSDPIPTSPGAGQPAPRRASSPAPSPSPKGTLSRPGRSANIPRPSFPSNSLPAQLERQTHLN
jgi:hypothetical protein